MRLGLLIVIIILKLIVVSAALHLSFDTLLVPPQRVKDFGGCFAMKAQPWDMYN